MPRLKKLGSLLLGLATLSGCYQIQDCCDRHLTSFSNRHYAKMAWCACKEHYEPCVEYLHDFGEGFKDGYVAIMEGGDGCPPTLPPRKYWGVCYQNDEGRCAIVAWYDGYQHGAAVALGDGVNGYGEIPTAEVIYRKSCQEAPIDIREAMQRCKQAREGGGVSSDDLIPEGGGPGGMPGYGPTPYDAATPMIDGAPYQDVPVQPDYSPDVVPPSQDTPALPSV